jgi:RimJ/RimL family protein N-acetyltransferase
MVKLVPATEQDFESFFLMKSDLNNIRWGGFKSAPDKESFKQWFNNQLQSKSRLILLLKDNDNYIGYCCLNDYDSNITEVSYGVLAEYANNGYGTKIIELCEQHVKGSIIEAWVADNNVGSVRCFEKNGYTWTNDHDYRSLPLLEMGGKYQIYKVL